MKKNSILTIVLLTALSMSACMESSKPEEVHDIDTISIEHIRADSASNASSNNASSSEHNASGASDKTKASDINNPSVTSSDKKDSTVIFGIEGSGGTDKDVRTKNIRENQGRSY